MTSQLETYLTGYNDGFQRALQLMQEAAAASARRDAPQQQPAAAPSRRRRGLRNSEAAMLEYIRAHPGSFAHDLRAAGFRSIAPAYALVHRRKVRREVAPKPWAGNGPRVRFFPAEPTNGA